MDSNLISVTGRHEVGARLVAGLAQGERCMELRELPATDNLLLQVYAHLDCQDCRSSHPVAVCAGSPHRSIALVSLHNHGTRHAQADLFDVLHSRP
jgi:hypothetical protein